MQTKTAKRSSNLIPEIARYLAAGEVVVLPTDTVYALVADAFNPDAVAKLKQLKQITHLQPMTVLTHQEKAAQIVEVSRSAAQMMSHFPYPVTMIMPAKATLPESITNGFKNVFVVCPDRFMYDLIAYVPNPMVCAAAAVSSDVKVKTFDMAMQFFDGKVPLIVDGGKSSYGRSGTLVDFSLDVPTIMTFGPVSLDDLRPLVPGIVIASHLMK
ncbi:SUA5/yciO/yrdC domain protein [Thalassoporum mexicanum PCC 7367]|uniref:L-threonylcarbamoyladenylate synthase n=1 Tax=Thalassoporum mexicanum TaxID=3457544 RepID=UPI00029FD3D2|nr:L-threonylcarbamoyladenylate synthase [Pseudanabaena sp. PCC 7367]AFY69439.1 SUA5/yciO/yrdC domain protein [Pseudanabaena sp. PCC 7367]